MQWTWCIVVLVTCVGASARANPTEVKKIEEYLEAVERRSKFNGSILVARKGEVVFQKGIGQASFEFDVPNTAHTLFRIASVTKNLTAVAVLHLCDRGLLSLDDKLEKFIPDFRNGDKIQIRHLLSHTSGIANYTRLPEFPLHLESERDTIVESLKARELEFAPGDEFEYSNSGYLLLGIIIERVSGEEYADYLRNHFFGPLGMKHTTVETDNGFIRGLSTGYKMTEEKVARAKWFYRNGGADGAICSSVEDLFKWYRAHARDMILASATKERM